MDARLGPAFADLAAARMATSTANIMAAKPVAIFAAHAMATFTARSIGAGRKAEGQKTGNQKALHRNSCPEISATIGMASGHSAFAR